MRIALVADLHGNIPATEALEKDLKEQNINQIFCLGDLVGKGPDSDYTFDWVLANCNLIVGGNWDYAIADRLFPKDTTYAEQLGQKRLDILKTLPVEMEYTLSGRRIRLFHGRPIMHRLLFLQDNKNDFIPFFVDKNNEPFNMLCYADCHRQGLRTFDMGMLLNCGSVGNGLGVPYCSYAIIEGEETNDEAPINISFRQLPYDRQRALENAKAKPYFNFINAYMKEIITGKYSRK